MRRTWTGAIVVTALLCAGILSGCASTPQYPIDNSAPRSDDRGRAGNDKGGQQMRSSSEQDNDWSDAVQAPLEDLNLKRQEIPDILRNAVAKPYDLTGLDHCDAIAAEVAQLDGLLGKDFDEPPAPPDTRTNSEKGKAFANKQAVGAMRNAARSVIPFRGFFRYVTGAERLQKEVDTAIQAGKVRRAYLKGVGMNKNCAPPAAPSWFKP
ncbi:MAG: hypothetical protein JF615_17675, partial [Asticcacaulis sp.]|nr:hypothetical protein [Asticcacaulis sp.]